MAIHLACVSFRPRPIEFLPASSWAEDSDWAVVEGDSIRPVTRIGVDQSADLLWFEPALSMNFDEALTKAIVAVEAEYQRAMIENALKIRRPDLTLREVKTLIRRYGAFSRARVDELWSAPPSWFDSAQHRIRLQDEQRALAAQSLLDQLAANTLLARTSDIEPQIPVVDMPIEPMAPCAPTFS